MKRTVSIYILTVLAFALTVSAVSGQSLYIPSGPNYVTVGDIDVTGNQITVEALITKTGAGVNIVSKHTAPGNVNYLMRPGSAEITTTNGYINAVTGFPLVNGQCYHLAFTYDGTKLDYYVNGCLASSTPHTGNLVTNNYLTAIGDQSNCSCESWLGYIDEVRIWNVARTQAEIQANMMDLPSPTTQTGLLAYYKFDGNYTNLQGNAAWNGTPVGSPQLQTNTACQNVDLSFQNQVTVTDVSCNGGSDGEVTVISSGGHPNYSYSPDGITYYPINTIGNLPAGNGVVWAQSGANSGCQEMIPITINEPIAITTSVTGTNPTCAGNDGTADLTVNGGVAPYTFAWSSGSTQEDPTNLVVGNNTVTITDANGCTATESITLNNPPGFSASATGTDPTCYGGNDGAADLTVNGGTAPFNYAWSSGSTQEDPTNLIAGVNTVTITDGQGCTATASVTLSQPTEVLPNAYGNYVSAQGACDGGGFANPNGGTPPYTYLWDNGQTTQAATGMCLGQHTVTVTDANGCTGTQTIAVNVPACLTDVDFNTWQQAGQPGNGNWNVQNGGAQVLQTINGNPTFFVTPTDYINVRMRGRMRTTDGDDDYMGVVFGFKNPLGASDYYDMWLFDWKQGTQTSGNFSGQEGFNLSHAVGTIPTTQYSATFWGHTTTPEFTVVGTNYGNNGWARNVWYDIEVTYTVNRAVILVDGDTIFDINDCFEPGRFGFYNYSQQSVTYTDFTYELFADFTVENQEVCAGDTAHFTFLEQCGNFNNLSQFDELQWNFGDGTTETVSNINLSNVNPTHVYQTGGNFNIQLIAKDTLGCRDTVYKSISVLQNPIADFTYTDQCFQDFTQFTDATQQGDYPLVGYAWLIDGNQVVQQNTSYQFASTGPHVVGLGVQDAYGCIDTVVHVVNIYELPQADFTPIEDCFAPNYPFEDLSTITAGTVDAWEWDFGDAANSNQQNPTHTYAGFGQYDVTLVALSDQGCGDTITQTVILHDNPVAGFVVPDICQLQPMQYLDTASIQEGTIDNYSYDLGDNTSSTDSSPTHSYTTAGPINVTQTVTSNYGCETSITLPAIVAPKPDADFTTQNVCLNELMSFSDLSSVVTGSIADWDWAFDDGNIDSVANPTNQYGTFGTYDVVLMVETDNGCRDTVEHQVEVYQLPVADFNFSDICLNATATFTDQSTSNSGSVDTWNWDLGDGTLTTGQGPIDHDYQVPDDYDVELIVETDLGCLDTIVQTITVHPMPVADFIADSVCFGEITQFTNQSTISTGAITNNAWVFGFGATSSQPNPTNIFPQTGYHPVLLTVTSNFGCKDTITKDIRVYVLPEPEFSHNDTCFEDDVYFINQSVISEGTIDQYDWDFGDSNISSLQDPVNHYGAEGFYQAELIATSNYGCTETVTHQVEIFALPQISYVALPDAGCQPLSVAFDNQSQITQGYQISSYQWDLGNGITSSQTNPQTVYVDSGYYDIQLIATTSKGCDDTLLVVDAIDVWPRPIAGFDTEKDRYIMFFPEVDIIDESFGATEWYYNFDDGFTSAEQNPTHEYQDAGTYLISQYVNNDYGCDDETSVRIVVDPAITMYIPNAFTPNNDGRNDVFIGDGVGVQSYEMWVYNRWGQIVFYTASIDEGWDGTYKGAPAESGVYVYRVLTIDVEGNDHKYSGEVHLVR